MDQPDPKRGSLFICPFTPACFSLKPAGCCEHHGIKSRRPHAGLGSHGNGYSLVGGPDAIVKTNSAELLSAGIKQIAN